MANPQLWIAGGPSKYDLQACLFDLEHPRLLTFKVFTGNGRRKDGEIEVNVIGVRKELPTLEEWRLTAYFLPEGLESALEEAVVAEFAFSSKTRKGYLINIDETTLGGRIAPYWEDLVAWN